MESQQEQIGTTTFVQKYLLLPKMEDFLIPDPKGGEVPVVNPDHLPLRDALGPDSGVTAILLSLGPLKDNWDYWENQVEEQAEALLDNQITPTTLILGLCTYLEMCLAHSPKSWSDLPTPEPREDFLYEEQVAPEAPSYAALADRTSSFLGLGEGRSAEWGEVEVVPILHLQKLMTTSGVLDIMVLPDTPHLVQVGSEALPDMVDLMRAGASLLKGSVLAPDHWEPHQDPSGL